MFLNVDLDLKSKQPLDALLAALDDKVIVLYQGSERRRYVASLEVVPARKSADSTINEFVRLLKGLRGNARRQWTQATRRIFNIGIEAPATGPFTTTIEPETVAALAALDAEIVITTYRTPTPDELNHAANEQMSK